MTKDFVLAILRKFAGYVSGEEISKALGISRAAVNTAVQSLRKDGYEIFSSTNKGYLLAGSPDKLTRGELLALLPRECTDRMICLETVDSTNSYLRQLAQQDIADGQIIIANEQTGGRGRHGRQFQSPKDKGIYLSMLMRLNSTPAEAVNITAWVAVAIGNAIEAVSGIRPGIKWVNDLVLNGKKICGILTEMSVESESGYVQHVITGIGVNANHRESDFSEDIRMIATSLAIETGKKINRARLTCEMINSLDRMRTDWPAKKDKYLEAYRRDCVILGKDVRVLQNNSELIGVAENIDDHFALVVRFADGHRESITSGEASVRGFYGYVPQ